MNLQESLKAHGLEISNKMPTDVVIGLMGSVPMYRNLFPEVFSMVDTLQNYLDKYNQAKETLAKAQEYVHQCEKGVERAKDLYDKILNTPTAYIGAGVETVAISPLPSLTAFYTGILTAQQVLEQANKALQKAQDKVDSVDNTIKSYKEKILNKLVTTKV